MFWLLLFLLLQYNVAIFSKHDHHYIHYVSNNKIIYHAHKYFVVIDKDGIHEVPLYLVDATIRNMEPYMLNELIFKDEIKLEAIKFISADDIYIIVNCI